MNKKKILIPILVILVLLAAGAGIFGYRTWYQNAHVFVEDAVYARDSQQLDLRGSGISAQHYEALRQQLPDCDIRWDVPFQGGYLPEDTAEITVTTLAAEDIDQLTYLPRLTSVKAEDCKDYGLLVQLQEQYPELDVTYTVEINGVAYPQDTAELRFDGNEPQAAELLEKLQYLPELKSIYYVQPQTAAADLVQLREAYPHIAITWEKDVMGTTYPDDVQEFDFSGVKLESVDELEALMPYFPSLEKLILCDCGLDSAYLAAYRDRVRGDYKVVWSIQVRTLTIRTDETWFMPGKYRMNVTDIHLKDLKYCEDMICVDVGHLQVEELYWVEYMPHLKYLIVADTWVHDITPIGTLKELVYLEIFKTDVTDYSPLLGCTALEDINLAQTYGNHEVFAQMPWLKNLWINNCGISSENRKLLTESLPDTTIEFDHGWNFGNGWREVPNYFDMRDILGMPYYNWGNKE